MRLKHSTLGPGGMGRWGVSSDTWPLITPHTLLTLGERIKLALLTHYHRLPGSAVPTLTFAPEDKEKGLGSETQVHHAQDSVIIDHAKDVVDWQGIVDHRR